MGEFAGKLTDIPIASQKPLPITGGAFKSLTLRMLKYSPSSAASLLGYAICE